jgi:hypothetical protein
MSLRARDRTSGCSTNQSAARTTAAPATTSSTKWLAVATTANAMVAGMSTANARTRTFRVARKSRIPSIRFHPAWKLGIAAYSLTSEGGRTVR